MSQTITKKDDKLFITIEVPLKMKGTYMYDEGVEWEQDAVCICIDNRRGEYSLNHTDYLDYKDSLQATEPICHFDSEEEAKLTAKKFNLPIQYIG